MEALVNLSALEGRGARQYSVSDAALCLQGQGWSNAARTAYLSVNAYALDNLESAFTSTSIAMAFA